MQHGARLVDQKNLTNSYVNPFSSGETVCGQFVPLVCSGIVVIQDSQVPRKLERNMFAFTPWRKMKCKQRLSGGARSYHGIIILTLNNLSRIKSRLGQVEELVCSRMKHSRLYVILLHLVLSAKSVGFEYVHRMSSYHLHFRIEFLFFWYLSLRAPIPGAQGGVCFL